MVQDDVHAAGEDEVDAVPDVTLTKHHPSIATSAQTSRHQQTGAVGMNRQLQLHTPLAKIYNRSVAEDHLPDEWKHANDSAFFRKGSRKAAGNYRPFSITCINMRGLDAKRIISI